jgi:hypothetical protein
MNSIISIVLSLFILYAAMNGMIWVAVGVGGLLGIAMLTENKPDIVEGRAPMFYNGGDLGTLPQGPNEQMTRIKYQSDWTGHEDDYEYHNAIGESIGAGVGRGLGLLR